MSWILFSVLAALTWAVVNIIDKYVLDKLVRKPIIPVMVMGVIGLIASIFIFIFKGFSYLSIFNILLTFISGFFYVIAILFYFKAVQIEEISRIIPLWHFAPLFTLILATIFLGEIFTPIKYIGILLLVSGVILISYKKEIKIGKAAWFMIFGSFLLSINYVLTKYLLNFTDYWTIFSYVRIGSFLTLIPILYLNFPELMLTVRKHGKKAVGLMSLAEILNLAAVLFITIAAAIGFVSLVNALSSVQPFFVLLFAVILSVFYPKILKEEIGKSVILLKITAIALMFAGVILIT
jgi:transporter family protein